MEIEILKYKSTISFDESFLSKIELIILRKSILNTYLNYKSNIVNKIKFDSLIEVEEI